MGNRYLELDRKVHRAHFPAIAVATSAPLPGRRPCCALGQWHIPGLAGAVDPAKLAGHHYGASGVNGFVYTSTSGLIDLGHLRDTADMVVYIDRELASGASTLELYEGRATITTPPADRAARLALAAAITYVESWAHELATWPDYSAFSPEDIVSNICGIEAGKRALLAGGPLDAALDAEIGSMLTTELGGRSLAETKAVLAKIENDWYSGGITGLKLLRRNFDGFGWPAGMPYDAFVSLPWLSPLVFAPQFSAFTFTMRSPVNGTAGVTLATMQATTNALRSAWVAANPGKDRP
ncbi:DUF4056 domain-containing protein [Solirubrobacter soli]|uniref:DUF4056 domain-containing protein n=1 Tax=Solirubrobacter soli TaxID=363832 RepID=UPI0003F663A8|nr:DUF4056 domain-containing protein [Solirubrobacter soli]